MATLAYTEHPRRLVISPPSNRGKVSLILESDKDGHCIVKFSETRPQGLRPFHSSLLHGCIGIVSVNNEIFVGVITEAGRTAEFEKNDLMVIKKVEFYCVSSAKYDMVKEETAPNIGGIKLEEQITHPCQQLIKLLSSGSFYFSHTFDLTRDLKSRLSEIQHNIIDSTNSDFVWNKSIMSELLRIKRTELNTEQELDVNSNGLLVPIIQGFIGSQLVNLSGKQWKIGIISRLSSNRAGTRFNARGIDDDGNVSNFVETEFLIYNDNISVSFIQLRGSVPLFWEQRGVQVSHVVKIARGLESTMHATRRHFEALTEQYENIQIVNLLSQSSTSPEFELNMMYQEAVRNLTDLSDNIRFHSFDFHAIIKRDQYEKLEMLAQPLRNTMNDFGFSLFDSNLNTIVHQQMGVFRTNCLDCLDRTNVVQTLFAKEQLKLWLANIGQNVSIFDQQALDVCFNNLWADNGDWLSRIYAGTGALKSSYTRNGKTSVFGFLDDAAKSVNRLYNSNFKDDNRQMAIDLLLTNGPSLKTPGHSKIIEILNSRAGEYSTTSQISVFCGTFNLNGKLNPGDSIQPWLISREFGLSDIVVIGVQELIQLTPGEYMTADTEKLRVHWEDTFLNYINNTELADYVVLRSIHLVALGLFVFVRKNLTARIREVDTASIKTGLMGAAANKGGIGLRLRIDDTTLVFVTAHFAAGQSVVDERNRDYWTITNGLKFKFKNMRILDHDKVFWLGDFNYRLNTDNFRARELTKRKEYENLWHYDQLSQQIAAGSVFVGFQEEVLAFDPTYKYDNNSSLYDTSEKMRIPSWTDRILFKGNGIEILEYSRGEILMSDHRPVRAIFKVDCLSVDLELKQKIESQLRAEKGSNPLLFKAVLPPPSSDKQKWWETHSSRDYPSTVGNNPFFDFPQPENPFADVPSQKPQTNLINLMD